MNAEASEADYSIYLSRETVFQYLFTGLFCTGLSVIVVPLLVIGDGIFPLLSLAMIIPGPLNLYFCWYFSRNPMLRYRQEDGLTVFRALRPHVQIPVEDVLQIRALSNLRYRLERTFGDHVTLVLNPTAAQALAEQTGIPIV